MATVGVTLVPLPPDEVDVVASRAEPIEQRGSVAIVGLVWETRRDGITERHDVDFGHDGFTWQMGTSGLPL